MIRVQAVSYFSPLDRLRHWSHIVYYTINDIDEPRTRPWRDYSRTELNTAREADIEKKFEKNGKY